MSEAVERAAMEACSRESVMGCLCQREGVFAKESSGCKLRARMARASLATLLEPTDEMVWAAQERVAGWGVPLSDEEAKLLCQEIIRAAIGGE